MPQRLRDTRSANRLYLVSLVVMSLIILSMYPLRLLLGSVDTRPYGPFMSVLQLLAEGLPLLVPALVVLALRRGRPLGGGLRLRFKPIALLAIPTAIVGYLVAIGLVAMWSSLWMALGANIEAAQSVALPQGTAELLVSIGLIGVWPALCEELLFRGMIMPAYEQHFGGRGRAILLSGLLFGLMHGQITGMPSHIFLGIIIGYLVVATGSIWTGVLYHLTNNALAMILATILRTQFLGNALSQALPLELSLRQFTPGALYLAGLMYLCGGGLLLLGALVIFRRYQCKHGLDRPPTPHAVELPLA